jgi:hypothetical protein
MEESRAPPRKCQTQVPLENAAAIPESDDGKQGNRGYESGALVATMVALLGSHDVCRRIAVVFQRVGG